MIHYSFIYIGIKAGLNFFVLKTVLITQSLQIIRGGSHFLNLSGFPGTTKTEFPGPPLIFAKVNSVILERK